MAWGHALLGTTFSHMRENAARATRQREERRRSGQWRRAEQPLIIVRSFEAPPTVVKRPRPSPGAS